MPVNSTDRCFGFWRGFYQIVVFVTACTASMIPATAWGQSAAESVPSALEAEFSALILEIGTGTPAMVDLAKVHSLRRFAPYMPRGYYIDAILAVAKRTADTRVRFALLRNAAFSLRESDDRRFGNDGFDGPLGKQGCLRTWSVVGPFENASMEGFDTHYGPELGEVGPFVGKMTEVDWRPLVRDDQFCVLRLSRQVNPSRAAVAYLAATLDIAKPQPATLLVGAEGAYKIWVNGELVASRRDRIGLSPDNDAWSFSLRQGGNEILVKFASRADEDVSTTIRVVDERGNPIDTASVAFRPTTPSKGGRPTPAVLGVLASITAELPASSPEERVWLAWLWSQVARQDVETPWRQLGEELESSAEIRPRLRGILSELFEEHWRRMKILEDAHKQAPTDPFLAHRLGRIYGLDLSALRELREADLYRLALRADPDFLPARIGLVSWYERMGMPRLALQELVRYERPDREERAVFVSTARRLEKEVGTWRGFDRWASAIRSVRATSTSVLFDDVSRAMGRNDVGSALGRLERFQEIAPWADETTSQYARLLFGLGRAAEAMAIVDALVAKSPGAVDHRRLRAELLLANGQRDAAIAELEVALKNRPQDQEVQDLLLQLRPRENRFYDAWMVTDLAALSKRHSPQPFEHDSLVDQVVTLVAPNGLAQSVYQRVNRVLNSDGVDAARTFSVSYQSSDEEIKVLRVRVHKKDGTVSEDYDVWESSDARKANTTYNDVSRLTVQANDVDPGDLVEVRYRVSQVANENFRGDYFGDIAYLQGGRPIGMKRYTILYPKSWSLYFRLPRLAHTVFDDRVPNDGDLGLLAEEGGVRPPSGLRSRSVTLLNVPQILSDRHQPGTTDVYDYLLVSNKETYDQVGIWWWNLVKEQLIVDAAIRAEVAKLIDGLATPDEKVRAIHRYVVKNTRYLHVGLGIHGWKPYRTTSCFRNRYGDCKDKAALLKVMLEEAGVKTNLVLVRTRGQGSVEPYPASMHVFNHAIAYVPEMDLFLDGTAEFNAVRELTIMDQGAQGLVVLDGGKTRWVTLPVDTSERNVVIRKMEIDLAAEPVTASGQLTVTGANAVRFRTLLEDPERRDEAFEKELSSLFPGVRLVRASYHNVEALADDVRVEFSITGGQLLRTDGARRFVLPTATSSRLLERFGSEATRRQDRLISFPYQHTIEITYLIPDRLGVERVPTDVALSSPFGSLAIRYKEDGPRLRVIATLSIDVGRVSKQDYPAFRKFVATAAASLNETISVVEKQ
jgi:cellulose synthase operon protein C